MSLKQWYIKNFKKREAVIIYVADESGRLTRHWCIPERDNIVRVEGLPKAVVISKETMRLSTKHNIPTFVVHHSNCESLDLADIRVSYFTADELRLILDNDEAHKVFNASKQGSLSSEGMIILVALALGFLAMFYFFNTKLTALDDKIPDPVPIVEIIEEV